MHSTFTISVDANSALADRLRSLRTGDRSEWVRSRLNGYDLATAELKRLKQELHEAERSRMAWARMVYERDHELGRHSGEAEHDLCKICADEGGVNRS